MPLSGAAYSDDPQQCVDVVAPGATVSLSQEDPPESRLPGGQPGDAQVRPLPRQVLRLRVARRCGEGRRAVLQVSFLSSILSTTFSFSYLHSIYTISLYIGRINRRNGKLMLKIIRRYFKIKIC